MEWHFVKYRPNETTRDPIVGEFFSTETIENPAQALVREGIQTQIMSRIKGKGNKDTELAMIQILRKHHISGWRRNQVVLGKPDFVFQNRRLLYL